MEKEISNKDIEENEKQLDQPDCQVLFENVKFFYYDLPERSKIKSSVIKTFFNGFETKYICEILDLKTRRINQSKQVDVNNLSYYLNELGFLREKAREKILLDWLEEIAQYQSGKTKRYFPWTGTIKLMYSKYILHFKNDYSMTYGIQKFIKVVDRERIGIHSGDLFYDEVKIKYNKMIEWKNSEDERFDEETFKLLEVQHIFNNGRKKMLRNFIQKLEGDNSTILMVLDFSQLQMSLTCKYHTFVIVLISNEEIEIPEKLEKFIIIPEKPETMTEIVELEEREKRPRGKNKEKDPNFIPSSFNGYLRKEMNNRKLDKADVQIEKFSPYHLHFHVAMKQTNDTPGQVATFVFRGMEILFESGTDYI